MSAPSNSGSGSKFSGSIRIALTWPSIRLSRRAASSPSTTSSNGLPTNAVMNSCDSSFAAWSTTPKSSASPPPRFMKPKTTIRDSGKTRLKNMDCRSRRNVFKNTLVSCSGKRMVNLAAHGRSTSEIHLRYCRAARHGAVPVHAGRLGRQVSLQRQSHHDP